MKLPACALVLGLTLSGHADAQRPDFLNTRQERDGRWDADGFVKHDDPLHPPCTGRGHPDRDVRVTALATLAYLADGSNLRAGRERGSIEKAIRWLVSQQRATGAIGEVESIPGLEDHAIATVALAHACVLSRAKGLRGPAQRAIDFLETAGDPKGPHFTPAVAAWRVMVREAVRRPDIRQKPPTPELHCDPHRDEHLRMWAMKRAQSQRADAAVDVAAAAELLVRVLLLDGRRDARAGAIAEAFVDARREIVNPARPSNPRVAFFATHAIYHLGGQSWKGWSKQVKAVFMSPRTDGNFTDSLDPADDPWSTDSGRLASTAIAMLVATEYYRYSRIAR